MMATRYRQEGARLQEARIALGLTQADLAEKIGSSLSAVKGYERGVSSPNRRFARAMATAGINMEYVFHAQGQPLIPVELREAHARSTSRAMSAAAGSAPDPDDDVFGSAHKAMEPMAQLRTSTQAIEEMCRQLEFTPPVNWVVLVQELMIVDGLSERGARRLLETLKTESSR